MREVLYKKKMCGHCIFTLARNIFQTLNFLNASLDAPFNIAQNQTLILIIAGSQFFSFSFIQMYAVQSQIVIMRSYKGQFNHSQVQQLAASGKQNVTSKIKCSPNICLAVGIVPGYLNTFTSNFEMFQLLDTDTKTQWAEKAVFGEFYKC